MKRYRVKPGRASSAAGLATGILFVILGVCVVIPSSGLFGVVWTGMAAVIAITSAVNVFSKDGVASSEVIVEDDERAVSPDGGGKPEERDAAARLKEAEELYGQGLITYEEYQRKREEIIDSV